MNLREIINSTRNYNFHSHTQFCDGRAPMEEMVEAAIAAGLEHYGFSPHSPIPYPSHCNMLAERVDEYIAEYQRLKSLYADRINLYLSMEIDYLGDAWGATHPFFSDLPLSYRLSSVHFIPTQQGREVDIDGSAASFAKKLKADFGGDLRYMVDTFYGRTLEMIERGGFDIIGHFDKIGANAASVQPGIEEEEWYGRHIDRIIDALRANDIIAEVNTKSWLPPVKATPEEAAAYIPRFYPSPSIIAKLTRAGVPIAVNSDAHFPIRVTAGRSEAFGLIDGIRGND